MRCFACDDLLPVDAPRDQATGRFYCRGCLDVIQDQLNDQEDDGWDVVNKSNELNYDEVDEWLKERTEK